jgi:hypothetical protein
MIFMDLDILNWYILFDILYSILHKEAFQYASSIGFTLAVKWAFHSTDHYRNQWSREWQSQWDVVASRPSSLHDLTWNSNSGARLNFSVESGYCMFERVRLFCFNCRISFFKGWIECDTCITLRTHRINSYKLYLLLGRPTCLTSRLVCN